jgi:dihydrofolate reductase
MRKIIAAMKTSLDMKYQGPQDYADWVDAWSEDYDLTPQIDACLLGGHMYRGYEQYWSAMIAKPNEPLPMTGKMATPGELAWAQAIPRLPHYVLSPTMTTTAWQNAHIIKNLDDVAKLKAQEGKDIYLMGGGKSVARLVDAGLVDEMRIIVYPLIAGGANTLFGSSERRRSAKLLKAHETSDGRIRMDYGFTL